MVETQLVAQILAGPGLQVLPNKLAGAEQHQAIDQLCSTGAGRGAIDEHQGLLVGFGQVCGDGWAITRCAGDKRVERGAPGVHGVGNQLDLFERNLRLVGHGSDPRCCCGWWG
jgi:hypothetical protein